ncbi:MAG: PD-(D/E)XK nuclease family transposase, partial [Marinifilaceae bacterium]|nr:PD-(D/E)XK nuclease family transposase [Marinifilaceae bacterium]
VQLKNQNNSIFFDKLTFIYIELPKFNKKIKDLESKQDKWIFIFRHLANLQNRPTELQERVFKKLFNTAKIANFSGTEKDQYEESLKHYRDIKNIVDTAKEEGIKQGEIKGRIEGKIEGREELEIEAILGMEKQNIKIKTITKVLNISVEKVEKIIKLYS